MINVDEVIVHAAVNSNVVPSFNLSEIPPDVMDLAGNTLVKDLIPMLNVDRSIDVTQVPMVLSPKNNEILLLYGRSPNDEQIGVLTSNPYTNNNPAPILRKDARVVNVDVSSKDIGISSLNRFTHLDYIDDYIQIIDKFTNAAGGTDNTFWDDYATFTSMPYNTGWNINTPLNIIFKLNDDNYVACFERSSTSPYFQLGFYTWRNIDWMPYFVDQVLDEPSGLPHSFLYPTEFWSIDFKFQPWIYTTESGDGWMKLMFKSTGNVAKRLILPKPIKLTSDGNFIDAPPKFRKFMVDYLALRLAVIYNMSSVDRMRQESDISYRTIVRHQSVPIHPMNSRLQIRNTLQSGQSRWWRFDGFNG